MGKIFFGGILPAATLGHDIQAPSQEQLRQLAGLAHKAMPICPLGVPSLIRQLQVPIGNLPEFQAKAAPILRWAREVALASRSIPPGLLHGDELLPHEIGHWTVLLANGPADSPTPMAWQAPLQALHASLQFFGWQVWGEGVIRHGVTIELTSFSAAFIKNLLEEDFRCLQCERLDKYREDRELPGPVDSARHSRARPHELKPRPASCRCWPAFTPTRSWTAARGSIVSDLCTCGEVDTIQHRLAGCTAHSPGATPDTATWQALQDLFMSPAAPTIDRTQVFQARHKGQAVHASELQWGP
jgi:hypothetical protein